MHPLDSSIDVKQAEILSLSATGELRGIGLTEDIQPIVDRDNSEVIVVAYEVLTIVEWCVALCR